MRSIDAMTREQIVVELMRISAYCMEMFNLNEYHSRKPSKTPQGSLMHGEALGIRKICASIYDDLDNTFGIAAEVLA